MDYQLENPNKQVTTYICPECKGYTLREEEESEVMAVQTLLHQPNGKICICGDTDYD